jgi:tetratricopeptide (TPR) repeat protein
MFFPRLRRHAKWVFAFLALVFGLSFVAFGVGAGGVGIGDIFKGHGSGSGAPSASDAQTRIQKNPRDAQAYRDLSTALQTKGDTSGAIQALNGYVFLRPKDTTALGELARLYLVKAQDAQQTLQYAQLRLAYLAPSAAASSVFSLGGRPLDVDPITSALESTLSTQIQTAQTDVQTAAQNAITAYEKIAKITPKDPGVELQLGETARAVGQTATAIAAYKRYLKLAPATDTTKPAVRRLLKQLESGKG